MKTCTLCQSSFHVELDEIEFLKKMEFKFGDYTAQLPEPIHCPDCRNQIRTAHRNEQHLHQRKSDLSGKQMISIYSPEAPWGDDYTIYTSDEWNSDKWDPLDYGRDFDFNRPFFEQFFELQKAVPRVGLITVANENCPFTTGTAYCKNCHLIGSSEYCEDCYYGRLLQTCSDSVDCTYLYDSQHCYECFSVEKSYSCVHVYYSQNCSDCWFSENLSGCRNCFLCTNLKNKEYHFMNQPLDKAEYERRVREFKGSYKNFKKAKQILDDLRAKRVHKYANITNSENCTGDFITGSQNCLDCYDVNDSQDCRYVVVGVKTKDTYDCSNMYIKPELNYQVLGTIETFHVAYSMYVFHSQDVLYSEHIHQSNNCFGCIGLHHKKYCIFNKQYSEAEYKQLVPKIIDHMKATGEWGQFFSPQFAPHGYNESLACEYYPLNKSEVLAKGWNWYEEKAQAVYQGSEVEIPDHIKDVSAEITQKILKDQKTGKLYKVIPQELQFYKNMGIPIPRLSPDQRHLERLNLRNPRKLHDRQCSDCRTGIQTTYSPDRPEKVLCEGCYLKEVY